jgi:hypothetical protein
MGLWEIIPRSFLRRKRLGYGKLIQIGKPPYTMVLPNLKFSVPPQRSLRLGDEVDQTYYHRGDAEAAEKTRKRFKVRHYQI